MPSHAWFGGVAIAILHLAALNAIAVIDAADADAVDDGMGPASGHGRTRVVRGPQARGNNGQRREAGGTREK
jgi:hypothetical protein